MKKRNNPLILEIPLDVWKDHITKYFEMWSILPKIMRLCKSIKDDINQCWPMALKREFNVDERGVDTAKKMYKEHLIGARRIAKILNSVNNTVDINKYEWIGHYMCVKIDCVGMQITHDRMTMMIEYNEAISFCIDTPKTDRIFNLFDKNGKKSIEEIIKEKGHFTSVKKKTCSLWLYKHFMKSADKRCVFRGNWDFDLKSNVVY